MTRSCPGGDGAGKSPLGDGQGVGMVYKENITW